MSDLQPIPDSAFVVLVDDRRSSPDGGARAPYEVECRTAGEVAAFVEGARRTVRGASVTWDPVARTLTVNPEGVA